MEEMNSQEQQTYDSLPLWLRRRIDIFRNHNIKILVSKPVPALNNTSILEALAAGRFLDILNVIGRNADASGILDAEMYVFSDEELREFNKNDFPKF